jgi:PilZ domain
MNGVGSVSPTFFDLG